MLSRDDYWCDIISKYIDFMSEEFNEYRTSFSETPISEICGYPGYFVDYEGRILKITDNGFKLVNPWMGQNGYLYVDLINDEGAKKKELVHRLIAENFIDNDNGHPFVRHYDDNKLNNSVSNLVWGTPQDNHDDMVRNGHEFRKEVYCYETDKVYYSCAEAAEDLGSSRAAITLACKGRIKSVNGCHICYLEDKDTKIANIDEWFTKRKKHNTVNAMNLETGEEKSFYSYTEAAEYIGCSVSSISQIMHGRSDSCKGWTFW